MAYISIHLIWRQSCGILMTCLHGALLLNRPRHRRDWSAIIIWRQQKNRAWTDMTDVKKRQCLVFTRRKMLKNVKNWGNKEGIYSHSCNGFSRNFITFLPASIRNTMSNLSSNGPVVVVNRTSVASTLKTKNFGQFIFRTNACPKLKLSEIFNVRNFKCPKFLTYLKFRIYQFP